MKNKLIQVINNPSKIGLFLLKRKISRVLPDKLFLRLYYYLKFKSKLDLENPKLFNEKIQWLKLYDRNPKYTKMVDKLEVRKIVSEVLGEEYLIPLIGVYETFDEIDFDNLPDQFVLKCTHDSGGIVICRNRSEFDIEKARTKINNSLNRNYYYLYREWPYKNVKPRIICEKLMVDESNKELKDYKVFCFDGEPKIIQLDYNRFINHQRLLYDCEWNKVEGYFQYKADESVFFEKPKVLNTMLELAKKLSKDFRFIRIDFYIINDEIYFGETTFYPEAGFGKFYPEELNELWGSWIKI